jgi:hypothetical protein
VGSEKLKNNFQSVAVSKASAAAKKITIKA